MIEAVMFWNEPNNESYWDVDLDPDWSAYAKMAALAADAVKSERPELLRVLGGISPIDASFVTNMEAKGVLEHMDVVAVHGFPFDWNHWSVDQWPEKLMEIRAVTKLPVWVTQVGASSFGAEEVQELALRRMAELLIGRSERIHWYSLYDPPKAWPATASYREAEKSSYYRQFYTGLLHEDGTPKRALPHFRDYTPELGVCQWFDFEDDRLEDAVRWLQKLGVRRLRTGLSWADSERPGALAWFDRQMRALERFDVTLTLCFTPKTLGLTPNRTSPPARIDTYAQFCAEAVRRYAG